jgi:UDP-2,3-diacylglucosamine pyrophosphatase LpxH
VIVFDAVLLSDLHIGSEFCQVGAVLDFLERLPDTSRLVLLGDVLEKTEHHLTQKHWRILSRLRQISDTMELIWVMGNHDADAGAVAHLVGASFVAEFQFESGGKRVLCVHGDAWDRFWSDHPLVTGVVDWFYVNLQRLSRRLARRAKLISRIFLQGIEGVRHGALEYARAKQADLVICGHTHFAEAACGSRPDSPAYFNAGCWTDRTCHYLTVKHGLLDLQEFHAVEPAPGNHLF